MRPDRTYVGSRFTHIFQSYPALLAILLGCIFSLVLLFLIESGFYFLNQQKSLVEERGKGMFKRDEQLGYKATPNSQVVSKKTRKENGEVVYEVVYSTERYGRRITPVENNHLQESGFILYFGGSFTFGEGVDDDETMPFYGSQYSRKYTPYNYGYRGYGPQQMLAKLSSEEIADEVNPTGRGILVYTFIDGHVRRAIGSIRVLFFARRFPYYVIDANDKLVRKGNFESGRPILTPLYRLMGKSQTLKYFHIDFPIINDSHIRLTARIISEAREIFYKKFHGDDFYVLIYPNSTQYGKWLIPYLEQANIKYLDYSSVQVETIPYDRHPTAKAHQTVAEMLVRDLEIYDNE